MARRWQTVATAALMLAAVLMPTLVQAGDSVVFAQRNKWLGQPATAQGVVPATAGVSALKVYWANAQNRSGGAAALAVVGLLADTAWEAGQVTAAGAYTADTADAQSATTNDFPLETTTINDGSAYCADRPFGAISLDVTTGGSGTTTTHVAEYWDGAAWTAIAATGFLVDVARAVDWATGEQLVLFDPPVNWTVGGSGTGIPAARYCLRIRRTNVTQATAALARRVYLGVVLASVDQVASNGMLDRSFNPGGLAVPSSVLRLNVAVGTADEGNTLQLHYESR